jgi:hypothetical protein
LNSKTFYWIEELFLSLRRILNFRDHFFLFFEEFLRLYRFLINLREFESSIKPHNRTTVMKGKSRAASLARSQPFATCCALDAPSGFFLFLFFRTRFRLFKRFFFSFFYVLVFPRSSLAFWSKKIEKINLHEKTCFFLSRESRFFFARGTVVL